ncbi:MAG TPA: putative sugar nucleotidyl transferase, partial [Candidatus Kapabacteria bacterium]
MAQSFDNVLLYEDAPARSKKFLPLTYTRSVSELHTGAFTAIERVQTLFREAKIYLHTRPELKEATAVRHLMPVNEVPVGTTLLVNARESLSFDPNNHWHVFEELPYEMCHLLQSGEPIEPPEPVREDAPAALWEVVHANAAAIRADLEPWSIVRRSIERPQFPHVTIVSPENLLVHPDAKIGAGVVLDCSNGPIIIESGVRIFP